MRGDLEKVLFDEPAIHRRLDDMAAQISNDYRDRELTVIAVLHGSLMFVADLLRRIPLPLKLDCLSVASYHGKAQSSGEIVFKLATASPSGGGQITLPDLEGRDILVLDDILDSGFTLAAVRETFRNRQTAQHSDMRAVEQKETTRPRDGCRLCWVRNRRRICSRLRARFQGTLPQSALYWRAEKRIAGATRQMKVRAQFYAQLRDLVGRREMDIDLAEGATVGDLLALIYAQQPKLRPHDKSILIGAGVEFVNRNYKLKPGDEISIMPPVQGG